MNIINYNLTLDYLELSKPAKEFNHKSSSHSKRDKRTLRKYKTVEYDVEDTYNPLLNDGEMHEENHLPDLVPINSG